MKIESITPLPASEVSQASQAASKREKAMAAFMGTQQKEQPIVQDATNVSPEEMGAVKAPSTETVNEQTDTIEETVAEAPKTEPPLSSQYAQLARKEKALRAQAQDMKAKLADIAKREAALQAQSEAKPLEVDTSKYVSREELKANAWKILQEEGVTGDQLVEQQLNAPSSNEVQMLQTIKRLEARIAAAEGKYEETNRNIADQQTNAYKQTVANISREVDRLVSTDSNFETIAATKSNKEVVKLIEETFKEDGVVLDIEEAAQLVEDHLLEKYTKISSIKKVQQRLQAAQAANASKNTAQKQTDPTKQQEKKTLSNNMSGQRPLSSRERAILAFQNKLK